MERKIWTECTDKYTECWTDSYNRCCTIGSADVSTRAVTTTIIGGDIHSVQSHSSTTATAATAITANHTNADRSSDDNNGDDDVIVKK